MLRSQIERLFDALEPQYTEADGKLFEEFKDGLNRGEIRAAEPDPTARSGWRANAWVKKGILLGFRMGHVVDFSLHGGTNQNSRRQLHCARRSLHAPDVHQCRRVCWRADHDRFSRARR